MSNPSLSSRVEAAPAPLRVGVAGLGVIGEGAGLRLLESPPYSVCAALVRDAGKVRAPVFSDIKIHTDTDQFLASGPHIVIDALSTGEAGLALIKAALSQGIDVVTANKQAIAGNLAELHALGSDNGVQLSYEASVGGGAPMIKAVRAARRISEIEEVTGILNGTVNYILSAVSAGGSFQAAVKAAQDAGFAEPDPSADLSGEDVRAKISILSYEAFGKEVDLGAIEIEPLTEARALLFLKDGRTWKQLATIRQRPDGELIAKLRFEAVDDHPFLSGVQGEGNALSVVLKSGETFTCGGKGAGRAPTVDSLFADLDQISTARLAAE